jgi:hypothetical protein
MADPTKLAAMLAARRKFNAIPYTPGGYVHDVVKQVGGDDTIGLYGRRVAIYPEGDRATRRHEIMHGIRDVASQDPSLSAAVPWWARGRLGSFEDELLARLAAGGDHISGWPMRDYYHQDPLKYALAMPVHRVATDPQARNALLGLLGTGGALMAYGLSSQERPAVAEE